MRHNARQITTLKSGARDAMVDRRACADTLFVLASALLLVVGASAAGAEPRLVDAAKNQDAEQVRTLLDRHADVNVRSEDGSTALLWAAHWNDLETNGDARH